MSLGFNFLIRPVGLPAALFAIAALTGCHPGGGFDDCPVQGGCGPRTEVNLGGTLSGLVGSRLTLQNNPTMGLPFNGPSYNGIETFLTVHFNTPYNVTVQTQPTNPSQTCVVTNGMGTAGTADVTNILVTCTTNPPRFAYVVNRGSNRQTGHFAYVTNQTDATVSAFTIDRNSGALTPVSGSPYPSGSAPTAVAIDPSNSFVYVTSSAANTFQPIQLPRPADN